MAVVWYLDFCKSRYKDKLEMRQDKPLHAIKIISLPSDIIPSLYQFLIRMLHNINIKIFYNGKHSIL